MPLDDRLQHGAHVMTVCNACRYCEQFCPVFPAMEQRRAFDAAALAYLANLCHNCGECLYACQYAPPHEFGINVPRTLATIRLQSYETYAWPHAFGAAFRRQGLALALGLAVAFSAVLLIATAAANPGALWRAHPGGDVYAVVPHGVLVALFGAVFGFAVLALLVGLGRFARDIGVPVARSSVRGLREALTLRHLHASGTDCVSGEEERSPWRRWSHHAVFSGFLLSVASTSVAAIYHAVFGWIAPYPSSSLPVVLGTLGGLGLLAGSAGLWRLRARRDPLLGDPQQRGLDDSFLALLIATSLTGLGLLVLRDEPAMGPLLIVHLGTVLALFVLLPYGKFVHGFYRTLALCVHAGERDGSASRALD